MRAILLAAALLVGVSPQEIPQGPSYVVVFELKQPNPTSPTVRINCVAAGNSEGEAVLRAYKYLAENAFPGAMERLQFLECQRR